MILKILYKYNVVVILFVLPVTTLIMLISSFAEFDDVSRNLAVAHGKIFQSRPGYRGGQELDYLYYVDGRALTGSAGYSAFPASAASFFIGKPVCVAYSKINTRHEYLLLLPSDYEKFNLPAPDSMKWCLKYKRIP